MGLSIEELKGFCNLKTDYSRQRKVAESLLVHSDGDPQYYDFAKYLHEPPVTRQFRKDNFVPITKIAYNKAFSTLSRIFRDTKAPYSGSDDLKQFIEEYKYDNIGFFQYLSSVVLRVMIDDPNAFLAWTPYNLDGVIPDVDNIELIPTLILSNKVRYYDKTNLIWKSCETSKIRDGQKETKTGEVFYCLTDTQYFRIYQINDKATPEYAIQEIYTHAKNEDGKKQKPFKPFILLGGYYKIDFEDSTKGYFKSFFDNFVVQGNTALQQFSDFSIANGLHAAPIREQEFLECDYKNGGIPCVRGYIDYIDSKTGALSQKVCPQCKGTGSKTILSGDSSAVLIRTRPLNPADEVAASSNKPLVNYITPPLDSLQFMLDTAEKFIKYAEASVYMIVIYEAQSAIAKEVDKEELYAFLENISNNYHGKLLQNSLDIIERYRNPNLYVKPTVTMPETFRIVNIQTLEEKLFSVDNSFIASTQLDAYIAKKFAGDPLKLRQYEFMKYFDKLYCYSDKAKSELFLTQSVSVKVYERSVFFVSCWEELLKQKSEDYMLSTPFETLESDFELILQEISQPTITPDQNGNQ